MSRQLGRCRNCGAHVMMRRKHPTACPWCLNEVEPAVGTAASMHVYRRQEHTNPKSVPQPLGSDPPTDVGTPDDFPVSDKLTGMRLCNIKPHWPEATAGYQTTMPGFCTAWQPPPHTHKPSPHQHARQTEMDLDPSNSSDS